MKCLKLFIIIILMLLAGCTDDLPRHSPVPIAMEPNYVMQGEQATVVIYGSDFYPAVNISYNSSSDSHLNSLFRLFLGRVELLNVTYIDTQTLAALVPSGMAAVIAIAMKVVGILLITSLLIIPAAAARRFAAGPEAMACLAAGTGAIAVSAGLGGSVVLDTPSGPSIVVAAALLFALSLVPGRGGAARIRPGGNG